MFRQDEKGEKRRKGKKAKEKKKLQAGFLEFFDWLGYEIWKYCRFKLSKSLITPKPPGLQRDGDTFKCILMQVRTDLFIWGNVKKKPTTTQRQGSLLHYPCRSSHNRDISTPLHLCPGSCQFCFQENSNKERLSASDTFSCWHLSYFPGSISVAATNALSPWLQFSGLRFGKKKKKG